MVENKTFITPSLAAALRVLDVASAPASEHGGPWGSLPMVTSMSDTNLDFRNVAKPTRFGIGSAVGRA